MDTNKSSELSSADVVIYALYILGGAYERIHTEDIALKCFELAQSKFSWTKYPLYPDIQPVRFALERMGDLVTGRSERKSTNMKKIDLDKDAFVGRRLTPKGIQWVKDNKDRLEKTLGNSISPDQRLNESRKLRELMNSTAYKKYLKEGRETLYSHAEIAESLTCTVNIESYILMERIGQFYSLAQSLNQQDVQQYLDFCKDWVRNTLVGGKNG